MSVIIFLLVLIVLIFVHELGHFLVAKACGIRVDEFGLGFPPKMVGYKYGETVYSLNWIPFGGFVKIFGENPDEENTTGPDSARSMVNKPKWQQILVLVAGISFNIIFAWLIISVGFMSGLPSSVDSYPNAHFTNTQVVVSEVAVGSPAQKAGFKSGDAIVSMSVIDAKGVATETLVPKSVVDVQNFISSHKGKEIAVSYAEGKVTGMHKVTPAEGVVSGKAAIGVGLDLVGNLQLPVHQALYQGAILTYDVTINITVGLWDFLKNIFIGRADLGQVTGPVGIVGLVGDASRLGLMHLLSFVAFISLNLAVVNILPFPALDGGRVLFVIIEAIKRSPIKPKVVNAFNTVGFALLLLLMLVITFHDVLKMFW